MDGKTADGEDIQDFLSSSDAEIRDHVKPAMCFDQVLPIWDPRTGVVLDFGGRKQLPRLQQRLTHGQ